MLINFSDKQTKKLKNFINHGILISGQSTCGKSTVAEHLEKMLGIKVCKEAASILYDNYTGDFEQLWDDPLANKKIVELQRQDLKSAMESPGFTVLDRSIIDTVSFEDVYKDQYKPVNLTEHEVLNLREFVAGTVFFMMPDPNAALSNSEDTSAVREYDAENDVKIREAIHAKYEEHGFNVVIIDWDNSQSVEEAIENKANRILAHLRKIYSDKDVIAITEASHALASHATADKVNIIEKTVNGSHYTILGVEKENQVVLVDNVRSKLLNKTKTKRNIQFVGDCELYSADGTQFAMEQVEEYIADSNNLITFGHSGLFNGVATDVNGLVIRLVERHSAQKRLVSNAVDACIGGIENYGFRPCISSEYQMVLVYNKNGEKTKFGDDCDISDKIMRKGDVMLVLEGGAQSLLQMLNALKQGSEVVAINGIRKEGTEKLSAARLVKLIKEDPNNIAKHLEQEESEGKKQSNWERKMPLFNQAREMLLHDRELQKKIREITVIDKASIKNRNRTAL